MSPETYCQLLTSLPPDERYDRLKSLNGNQLFCDAMQLLPQSLRSEFFWFEKRIDLESSLKHPVDLLVLQQLIDRGDESLQHIVEQWADGDEIWYYHAIPGDTGYALVRDRRVVSYCTLEIWSV
jgi:hypothetical protein